MCFALSRRTWECHPIAKSLNSGSIGCRGPTPMSLRSRCSAAAGRAAPRQRGEVRAIWSMTAAAAADISGVGTASARAGEASLDLTELTEGRGQQDERSGLKQRQPCACLWPQLLPNGSDVRLALEPVCQVDGHRRAGVGVHAIHVRIELMCHNPGPDLLTSRASGPPRATRSLPQAPERAARTSFDHEGRSAALSLRGSEPGDQERSAPAGCRRWRPKAMGRWPRRSGTGEWWRSGLGGALHVRGPIPRSHAGLAARLDRRWSRRPRAWPGHPS